MNTKLFRFARRTVAGARNVMELARAGRLGKPYGAAFEIIDDGPHHRLRRYATCSDPAAPVAILVPPLMVTSEVYDLEEGNSAVGTLGQQGVRPFVVDFGAPEREEGGMRRTLDDHVLAVVRSIAHVRRLTGKDIHLLGYSQGGMFAYQSAAYLRSEGVRSLVTFGAPVDIHKSLPSVHKDVTAAFIHFIEPIITRSIERLEGLPGTLTSTGFKLLSTRKEIAQRVDFLRKLHDRRALVRREARRRFLGGEGFVAWPGPAFREFVEQFIVHNRMLSGGFVLSGRTVTLADIHCPILAFIGTHDDMARPAAVRAIVGAAPEAKVAFASVDAGHFGIVVGSRATKETWPTVAQWIRHVEGLAPLPRGVTSSAESGAPAPHSFDDEPEGAGFAVDVDLPLFVDTITSTVRAAWERLGDFAASTSDAVDAVRYQEPRLRRLADMTGETRTSAGLSLAERVREAPDGTFFMWQSRAFTYRDADTRVTNVVKGLFASGVRPADRVGVVMGSRPSFLTMVTALSRLGAVAVLAPPEAPGPSLRRALRASAVKFVATDPQHIERTRAAFDGDVLVLGGGSRAQGFGSSVVDMEAIDPARITLPEELQLDAGIGRQLAIILLRPGESGELRAAHVTNHRWALSAVGAAAACTLKPDDTVYCCIPLHHPAAILVSVGSALTGGARLALSESFDPESFLAEVRRYGATVAFYAGEMLRPLVRGEPGPGDRTLPLRLFAGSGMRDDLWRKLKERFGVGVMEFYAATTQKVIMANASGEKVGALGRRLPGCAQIEIAKLDMTTLELIRDRAGRLTRTFASEPGLLVAQLQDGDEAEGEVIEGAFAPGDRWFVSSDVLVRDADGDAWFVDSRGGFVMTPGGAVSTRRVEGALYGVPGVELAAAWGESTPDGQARTIGAALVSRSEITRERLEEAIATLLPFERPSHVMQVDQLPITEGFRPNKALAKGHAQAGRPLL